LLTRNNYTETLDTHDRVYEPPLCALADPGHHWPGGHGPQTSDEIFCYTKKQILEQTGQLLEVVQIQKSLQI